MVVVVIPGLAVLTVAGGHDLAIGGEKVVGTVVVLPALTAAHRSRAGEIHNRPINQYEAFGFVGGVRITVATLTGATHAPAHRFAISTQCHGR